MVQSIENSDDQFLLTWSDRFAIGIPVIDAQHKKLLEILNRLYAGVLRSDEEGRRYFTAAVKELVAYAQYHFASEEKLLERIKYPGLIVHKNEHKKFVTDLLARVQDFESGKRYVPNMLVRFLKDWILAHIAMRDREYSAYIYDLKERGLLQVRINSAEDGSAA